MQSVVVVEVREVVSCRRQRRRACCASCGGSTSRCLAPFQPKISSAGGLLYLKFPLYIASI